MEVKVIKVMEEVLGLNDEAAEKNKALFASRGILAVNIMSSPGAGKTSLLQTTIRQLKAEFGVAVIEGDITSQVDADTLADEQIPVVQINTEGSCHLDAGMIAKSLDALPLEGRNLLFIENVGNLVCPALFDLGEDRRVMLTSTPEGDDKPYKYPLMFTEADVIIINKIDLLPYVNFNLEAFRGVISGLNPQARIFPVSCTTGEGLDAWFDWLKEQAWEKGLPAR